jgi:hypothetical protein
MPKNQKIKFKMESKCKKKPINPKRLSQKKNKMSLKFKTMKKSKANQQQTKTPKNHW